MLRRRLTIAVVSGALLLAVSAVLVNAQSGGGYDLSWNTFDGGGGTSSGGSYSLSGTIGQADAGQMSGGGYTLNGGYWEGGSSQAVYLPLTVR